jgi:hypothetical protein
VREALLAALDDCTEEVRYEAAIAFCEAAGNPCSHCDRSGCCNAAVMTKLEEMAHGQDEKGCFKESSARVRAAAENALNACREKIPPAQGLAPAPETPQKEVPIQPTPAVPESLPGQPEKPSATGSAAASSTTDRGGLESGFSWAEDKPAAIIRPISMTADAEVEDESPAKAADAVAMARIVRPFRRCPPGYEPMICPRPAEEGKAAPGAAAPEGAAEPAAAPSNALAGNYGAAPGPMSSAPNMIGDFFGGGGGTASIVRTFTFTNLLAQEASATDFYTILRDGTRVARNALPPVGFNTYTVLDYNDATGRLGGPPLSPVPANGTLVDGTSTLNYQTYDYDTTFRVRYDVDLPSPSNGGVVGRTKIAENTSPIPRDRLLLNYSYFDGVPLFPGGVNVNRFTPGFEKTFFNGWTSLEMKIPMATTLDSTIVQGGTTSSSHDEFGNMAITFKTLVLRRETIVFSGGLMVTVPTADDTLLVLPDGTPLIAVRNRSTHLGPFLGFLWAPNDRFFAQGFLQWDVAANGNPVLIDQQQDRGLECVGDLHDATFQYLDLGIGSWLYRSEEASRRLTGLAWTAELHWNKSLEPTDVVTAGDFRVGDYGDNIEALNLTVGAHLELRDRTTITAGYTCPLGGGRDREFNGEFRLMLNRFFGASYRRLPAPPL